MGLDTVELVMEIEEAFSVSIPDEVAVQMQTAGDVFEFLLANVDTSPSSPCLTAATFYALRTAAKDLGNSDRLRPRDSIYDLLPQSKRADFWSRLQAESGLRLPSLRRPTWMVSIGLSTLLIVASVPGTATFYYSESVALAFTTAAIIGLTLLGGLELLTRPYAVLPCPEFSTLRGLAQSVLALNYKELSKRLAGPNEHDLWIALRGLISYQLGVPVDVVTRNVHFVHDLGCD